MNLISAEQREAFVSAYLSNGLDAAAACAVAGIPGDNPRRVLRDGHVCLMMAQRRAVAAQAAQITTETVVARLAAIAFADAREISAVVLDEDGAPTTVYGDSRNYSPEAAALHAGGGKVHDQLKALAILAQHAGITLTPERAISEIVRTFIRPASADPDPDPPVA